MDRITPFGDTDKKTDLADLCSNLTASFIQEAKTADQYCTLRNQPEGKI